MLNANKERRDRDAPKGYFFELLHSFVCGVAAWFITVITAGIFVAHTKDNWRSKGSFQITAHPNCEDLDVDIKD
jgi:hypothetical protein